MTFPKVITKKFKKLENIEYTRFMWSNIIIKYNRTSKKYCNICQLCNPEKFDIQGFML